MAGMAGMAGIVAMLGSDDQAEMGLIWSSGGNSNDISVIAGIGMGMVIGIGIGIVIGIVAAGMGMCMGMVGIVAGMVIGICMVAAVAGTRPVTAGGLAFRPSFFRCMSCSK